MTIIRGKMKHLISTINHNSLEKKEVRGTVFKKEK